MINSKNSLLDIVRILNDNDVDYIIAGGVAVVLQGVERLTMDLGSAVALGERNLRRFLKAMRDKDLSDIKELQKRILDEER